MSYRRELGLLALVAAVLVVVVWAATRGPEGPSADLRSSTLLSGPNGSKALHEVLVQLGHPSQRRRTSLFTLAQDGARRPGLLAIVDPPMWLESAELEEVASYVEGGGAVLAVGEGGGVTGCVGWERVRAEHGFKAAGVAARASQPDLKFPRGTAQLQ